jgi:hypothetical protein
MVTNQNCVHEEMKGRLNLENAYCHAVQNSTFLLFKNIKIKMFKTITLPVSLCWCKNLSLSH